MNLNILIKNYLKIWILKKKRLIGMKENFKKMFKIIIKKHNLIQFKIFTKARLNNSYKNLVISKV